MNGFTRFVYLTLFALATLSAHAGEFTVSTNSYLGGPGDLDEIRGARVQSDGTIVLGAVIGSAAPGGAPSILLNGADTLTPGAVVRLSQDGQSVLSVTRLSGEIWDLSVDGSDNIYVAAGTDGLIKLNPTATSILYQKRSGNYIYRVDAAPNGDVACLQPSSFGPGGEVRIEDNTPGVGTIHAYDAAGAEITHFDTWGGRHAVDVALYDGGGNPADARIMWIGWRNGYAYTGPLDACGDSLVDGISTTVHIGSLFGASYSYDGTNDGTELVYHMYDRGETRGSVWLDSAPATIKDRRQEHINPEFFNGPTDLSNLYTLAEIDAARSDGLNWNDWLWIEEDAGNSFVGCPENIIYQEAFDWYQKGFPDSPEYVDDSYRYPNWCVGRNDSRFVGYPYVPGGNNMADTRGLRLSMGRDGKLYGMFESAGGNTELRWDPFDLATGAPNAGGDLYHQFLNIGSAHAITIGRYEPVDGSVLQIQEYASNYRSDVGQTISNTTRAKGGDIAADERGRVYFVGVSAGELPLPTAANYNGSPAFNPYPDGTYLGGGYLIVLRPDMSGRAFATRLTFGYNHAVDARILGSEPLSDPATIVFGGKDFLGGPLWLKNPLQPIPGFGAQDGVFTVLGGTASEGGDVYPLAWGLANDVETASMLKFRNTSATHSALDYDNDGFADDARSEWAFSATQPLSPSHAGYTGLPFYGGLQLTLVDKSVGNWWKDSRTGVSGDAVTDAINASALAAFADMNIVLFFDKADFPGLDPTDRLSFTRGTRCSVSYARNWGPSRYLLRDGNTFYVSEQSAAAGNSLGFSGDFDDGRWAAFDPATDMEFDQENAVFAHRDFQDITAFGILLDYDGTTNTNGFWGIIRSLSMEFAVNAIGDSAPTAAMAISPQLVAPGDQVTLDASASSDPDGMPTFTAWDLADNEGSTSSGPVITHSYAAPGHYRPTLQVYDTSLNSDSATASVWVGPAPSRGADLGRIFASYDGVKGQKDWRRTTVKGVDLDGDGVSDDGWTGAPFSATVPMETRKSTSLYGGIVMEILNSSIVYWNELRWDGAYAVLRPHPGDSGAVHTIHGALFIDQSDFLRGGASGSVSLGDGDFIETRFGRSYQSWPFRWLVREGETFHLSESTFTDGGVHRIEFPTTIRWAAYDPAADLDFDAATADFAPRLFSDVTAVGLYFEREPAGTGAGWFEIPYIMAAGTVTPFVNSPPVAAFTHTLAESYAPAIVDFDASTSTDDQGVTTAYWDFGDGSFMIAEADGSAPPDLTARHTYSRAGAYTVRLSLEDAHGATATLAQTIVIDGPAPTRAVLSATPVAGVKPLPVSFDGSASTAAAGTEIVSFNWRFGDGAAATGPFASHTYSASGTYYAILTVTDTDGSTDSAHLPITVDSVDPLAAFTVDPPVAGRDSVVAFDGSLSTPGAGSILSGTWNFGEGQGAQGITATHTFAVPGTYVVSLNLLNSEGGGDVASRVYQVVDSLAPTASLQAVPLSGTAGLPVSFDASGSFDTDGAVVLYDYDFGDGSVLPNGSVAPNHTYTSAGTYTATLIVTDDSGAMDTASVVIHVTDDIAPPPPAAFLSRDGENWIIRVPSVSGYDYTVVTATDLDTDPAGWPPAADPQPGNGDVLTFSLPVSNWPAAPRRFFVVKRIPD